MRNLFEHGFKIGCFGFIAFLGSMILASAVESIFPGPFDLGEFVLKVVAGVAFGGTGLGALYVLYGHEHLYPLWQKRRFERYAERPWERKRAWRTGRIPYRKPTPAAFLWIFALAWNSMVTTVLWGNRDLIAAQARENWFSILPAALFPLIGLGILFSAINLTFARRYADRALFVMATVPAWTGGILEGTIQTRIPLELGKRVKLKLASADSAPIEAVVPPDRLAAGPGGLTIPVSVEIPENAAPTDEFNPKKKVVWTLEARMVLPKNEFFASFKVPVYWRAGGG